MRTLLILALCVGTFSPAFAHAFVDHASPAVGGTVHASPVEIKVWFTEKLVLHSSDLRVLDASGTQVDKHDKHLDRRNGELLIVSIPALKPGRYTVVWRAVPEDNHITNGAFRFTVGR